MATNPALAASIEAHRAASAAVEAFDCGPADVPESLVDAETSALQTLALTPCADDEQFFRKLKYMLENQRDSYGEAWTGSYAKEILTALALHMLPPMKPEGAQRAVSTEAEKPEALDGILHVPSREANLEGLDDHLRSASALARGLWLASREADTCGDERDRDAIVELASQVADHASAALYCFLKVGGRNG